MPDSESKLDEFEEGVRRGLNDAKRRYNQWLNIGPIGWTSIYVSGGFILVLFMLGTFTQTRFIWSSIVVILGAYIFVDWAMAGTFFSVEKECAIDESGKGIKVSYHAYYLPYAQGNQKKEIEPRLAYFVFVILIVVTTIIGGLLLKGAQFLNSRLPLWESSFLWTLLVSAFLYDSYLRPYGERISLKRSFLPRRTRPEETGTPTDKGAEPPPPSRNSGPDSSAQTP